MEKSRSHGSCSSLARPNISDGAAALRQISESPLLKKISTLLGTKAQLHLVGGTVREAFSGVTETDVDLACLFTPEQTHKVLGAAGITVVDTGIKHGTVTAVLDRRHFEITTFRRPGATHAQDYSDSIQTDLAGRDFTINAMAFSLDKHELIDPFLGRADLETGILRAVGDPAERFAEDALRVLRMVRFGPACGRSVDASTAKSALKAAQNLKSISPERIREELKRIVASTHPTAAFAMLKDMKILDLLLPEMLPSIGFEQNDFHMHDVFDHTLWVMERCPSEGMLRWVGLFHDLGKPQSLSIDEKGRRHFYNHEDFSTDMTHSAMKRLKFSNDEIEKVATIVKYHMRPIDCGPAGVRRLLRDLGEHFEEWLIFKSADAPPKVEQDLIDQKFAAFKALLNVEYERRKGSGLPKLAIGGSELIELGMKPGPAMGALLKRLEEMIIENPELNERESMLAAAKELLGKP